MSDLNNAKPTPTDDIKARTEDNAAEMREAVEAGKAERKAACEAEAKEGEECPPSDPVTKNDSIIAPEKSKEETLRGFHGG